MTLMAAGMVLSGIGGLMGYGAGKKAEKQIQKISDFVYGGRLADIAQTRSDLAAQRLKERRMVTSSAGESLAASAAMGGNVSALRAFANEKAVGMSELQRLINRDKFVLQRMQDNAEIEKMNGYMQADQAGDQAIASLIGAGVNIASFGMMANGGFGGGGGNPQNAPRGSALPGP